MYRLPMTSNHDSKAIGRLKLAVNIFLQRPKMIFGERQHFVEKISNSVGRTDVADDKINFEKLSREKPRRAWGTGL